MKYLAMLYTPQSTVSLHNYIVPICSTEEKTTNQPDDNDGERLKENNSGQ